MQRKNKQKRFSGIFFNEKKLCYHRECLKNKGKKLGQRLLKNYKL